MSGVYGRQANRYNVDIIKKVTVKLKYGKQAEASTPEAIDYSSTGIQLADDKSPDIKKGAMLLLTIVIGDDAKVVTMEGQVVWVKDEDSKMSYGVEFFEESPELPKPEKK